MAIKYPDRIESNNPLAYGIIKATEIAGQRLVKQLSDLYKLPDAILSESKTGEDAEGLIWIVGKDLYQLISWLNRNNALGWLKVIPFNEKMFDRFYNLDGNMVNSLTGYIKATELLNLLENDSLLNALGKLEYKSDLTYDLINSVYEGVHTIEELREMLKILEEIQNSSEILNSYLSKYLLLAGGIMSGSIDMNNNPLKNAGFEVVTSLPTTNLFVGRQVTYEGKVYTYNNEWLNIADDLGGKPETHEENFVYQPTASDLSIKDGFADIKKLKGNTVVWNQKIPTNGESTKYGITITYSKDKFTIKGTTTINAYTGLGCQFKNTTGHKFYIKFKSNKYIDENNLRYFSTYNLIGLPNLDKDIKGIYTIYTNGSYGMISTNGEAGFKTGSIIDIEVEYQLIDLTQMFGKGNEPATVEEFEAMFPKDYYEYNEGELMSFDGKGVKSVGFNQFDKSKVKKNTTLDDKFGLEQTSNASWCSDFIRILPNANYYISHVISIVAGYALHYYDGNFNHIKGGAVTNVTQDNGSSDVSGIFTTPANAVYIRFRGINTTGYDNVCLNLSHSGYRDGEYEPYEDYRLQFQDGKNISQLTGKLNGEGESVVIFPDGLRSAGTVYDEIVYDEATGKHKAIKRIGSVDMGTLNYSYNNGSSNPDKYPYGYFTFNINNIKAGAYILTLHYIYMTNAVVGFKTDKSINNAPTSKTSYLIDSSYTDADSLKASLQGQILYYELAEPEVYELDFPINTSYEAYDFGTEEVLYNDDKEVNIPMKASIEYGFNAVDMIRSNYFDIQKLKRKAITTDGGVIEGDLSVDNLTASKSVTSPTFIGDLDGKAKNADKADTITQSITNETNTPILVRGTNNTVTYNPNFTLNKFNEYLPLTGGTMSGNVDMGGNEIKNTNFELVESLPTENLYEGRQVTYNGKIYTYYKEKWISTADDLGDLKETLSSEFVFRPTADTHSVKDEFASVKSVKGNTVVWNQLDRTENGSVEYEGLTCSWNNGILTINGEVTEDGIFYGVSHGYRSIKSEHNVYHKINISGDFVGSKKSFVTHSLGSNSSNFKLFLDSKLKQIKGINKADNYTYFAFEFYAGDIFTNVKIQSQLIDLTQMFGEGNEPTSVEEFEKLYSHLPGDYNEGSLLNINADNIKSIGFNQWDEEWEPGMIGHNGNTAPEKNAICSKNYIKVIPDTDYFFKADGYTGFYACFDENYKNIYPNTAYLCVIRSLIHIPANCHYIKFFVNNISVYNKDICLNLSHNGEKNGEYEPYEEHIVNLPIKKYFPDGLKSAGTAYDEIVFDKNIGKYKAIQRIGSVDMGTLDWAYAPESEVFYNDQVNGNFDYSSHVKKANIITPKYPTVSSYTKNYSISAAKFTYNESIIKRVWINDSSYTSSASLRASLQGQILYYELAEPIETIIDDYDLIAYKANDWGTEEILSEEPTTPIKADIEYNFDATDEIRNHMFEIKKLNKKIDELTALVESLLTTLNVNYEKVEN